MWTNSLLNGMQVVGVSNHLASLERVFRKSPLFKFVSLNSPIKNPNPALDWPCPRGVYSWGECTLIISLLDEKKLNGN